MAHPRKTAPRKRPSLTVLLYTATVVTLCGYFTFAAVQGEYGLFRRLQIEAELSDLQTVSGSLDQDLAVMRNQTLRLSDSYLDLDLLDQQVRDVLGYLRTDEVVIR